MSICDLDLLERVTSVQRAVVTLNRDDFKRLQRENPNHAGVIICTEDPDRIGQAWRIDQAINKMSELRGKLIRVYRPA